MKSRRSVVAALLLSASFLFAPPDIMAEGANETILPVVDRSDPGSPLRISGTVRLRETASAHTATTTLVEEDIVAENISSKTILALVAWLDVTPTYTAPQRSVKQYECFFASDVIKPGEQHSLSDVSASGHTTMEDYSRQRAPKTPKAEIRVVYVQFLDGSTFGQEAFARHLLAVRRIAWQHLRRLDRAYKRGGEPAFLEELSERVEPSEVDTLLQNVRETQRTRGTPSAIGQVRLMLKFATERGAALSEEQAE